MRAGFTAVLGMCALLSPACQTRERSPGPEPLAWSGWIEDAAVQRGGIRPGDVAQFGCPPGWRGVDDTSVAMRDGRPRAVYRGADPPPREGTVTCVAQREFALPAAPGSARAERDPVSQPLAPVSLQVTAESTTILFRRELPPDAPLYIGQDTPCGPRLIGVRLGDLMRWLADPEWRPARDFLGMVSAGCPAPEAAR